MLKNETVERLLGREILTKQKIYSSPMMIGFQMDNIICLVKKVDNKINMSFKHISRQ